MSWFVCNDCGHIFEDGEQKTWAEPHGEVFFGCPVCGGGYLDAQRCSNCGSVTSENDLQYGVCENCVNEKIDDYKYDINGCFEIAKKAERKSVKINVFLAEMFSQDQIEKALLRELVSQSAFAPVDCSTFTTEDKDWFVENALKYEKEVNKQ